MKKLPWFILIVLTISANFLAVTPQALAEEKVKQSPIIKFDGLAVPIVEDGQLRQYILVRFYVEASSSDSTRTGHIFQKLPYIRDAIIQTAYKSNLGVAGQANALDQDKFRALVRQSWAQFVSVKDMKRVVILEIRPGPRL
jgi:hypothetical protein